MASSPTKRLMRRAAAWMRLAAPALVCLLLSTAAVSAARLDEMSIERWKQLRETERYQLNVAEKYYAQKEWKVALAEYEKYLTLYEASEGAPYAQLKWSICQANLRKTNTAIKEGYQSVIDYWPDSADAVAAAYYIGSSYRDMGELRKAKAAYREVLNNHPDHLVAVYSMVDLIDISNVENDAKSRLALWKKLAFDTSRGGDANSYCIKASQDLATHYFWQVAFDEALESLKTSYSDKDIPYHILYFAQGPIGNMTGDAEKKAQGEKLADLCISYIRKQIPANATEEETKKLARQYWYYVADLESSARRYENVPKVYDEMKQKLGVDDGLLGRLAEWYKTQNRWDEARAAFRQFANKIEGLNQVAYSYRQQKEWDLAVTSYRTIAGQDPENQVRWVSEVGATYWEAHNWQQAIATYEELITLDTEGEQKWRWQIASAYHHWGKYPEAIANYRLCTNFPENTIQMAACNRALSKFPEAILLYNQVLGGAPGRAPWALLQIGYTYEQAGKKEQAIRSFQQVCSRFPKDGHASQAHAHLENKYKITQKLGGAIED